MCLCLFVYTNSILLHENYLLERCSPRKIYDETILLPFWLLSVQVDVLFRCQHHQKLLHAIVLFHQLNLWERELYSAIVWEIYRSLRGGAACTHN